MNRAIKTAQYVTARNEAEKLAIAANPESMETCQVAKVVTPVIPAAATSAATATFTV